MPYVYLLVFRTAPEASETGSATVTGVPQPSASYPTRYHAVCFALQVGAGYAGHVWCDGCFWRRKPGHPARSQGGQRGLPRSPCSGGIPSSNAKACVESWQLAPVVLMTNGMPRSSQIKMRLLPRLAGSAGLGSVCSPQKLHV